MKIARKRLLAAGISILAIQATFATRAAAQTVEGVRQEDSGTIAINLYEVEAGDIASFGTIDEVSNPGGSAVASAPVLCAELATCTAPGAIEQFASGTDQAENGIAIAGTQEIHAIAAAEGATATAMAFIDTAILQLAVSGGSAANSFDVSGSLAVLASASAVGSDGAAHALASIETAILQIASADDGAASAALTNDGSVRIAVTAVATGGGTGATTSGASLSAFARVKGISQIAVARAVETASGTTTGGNFVVVQSAIPVGPAAVSLTNSGSLTMVADASAQGENFALARATLTAIDQLAEGSQASAEVINSGTIDLAASAAANGTSYALAAAFVDGFHQTAQALATIVQNGTTPLGGQTHLFSRLPVGSASAALDNSGEIDVTAVAHAVAGTPGADAGTSVGAVAGAYASAILQSVAGSEASAEVSNSGTLFVGASAVATAEDFAAAQVNAIGIRQFAVATGVTSFYAVNPTGTPTASGFAVYAVGPASVALENSGAIDVVAHAEAHADTYVRVDSTATGLWQSARGLDASLSVENSGTFNVVAQGTATGDTAFAFVRAGGFIQQGALAAETASAQIDNSGELDVGVAALVHGDSTATGIAIAVGASQTVSAGSAGTASFDNSGEINVSASVEADGGAFGIGAVLAIGAQQSAAANDLQLSVDNSGDLSVVAHADAEADASTGFAYASAIAFGLRQTGFGAVVEQDLTNSGTLDVEVTALAAAPAATADDAFAIAYAIAVGARQTNYATTTALETLTNSGTINVHALASAAAVAGSATAAAAGVQSFGGGLASLTVDIVNSGAINASATATAPSRAYALARGIYVNNAPSTMTFEAVAVDGTLTNSGEINVVAFASATDFTLPTGTTFVIGGSSAFATGILVFGGANNMTITNSGSINVDAIAADGMTATAMGIVALSNAPATSAPTDVLTIDNSGDIIVRQSVDGGETWQRGLAINVAGNPDANVLPAANKTVVNLLGGNIYGNIAVQAGDEINVEDDETAFDGIITPNCLHESFVAGDSPTLSSCGVGTLNISNGGTLFLQDPRFSGDPAMYDGPSYAFVNVLNMGSTGTLAFGLEPATGGNQAPGSYPQLFADIANLDGTLEARITTPNGLFADSYFWDNVIDANTRGGTFDQCVIGGAYSGSVLLGDLQCSYDSQNNVDLALARVAFDEIGGVNRNGRAVGGGLESIYDTGLTGGIADLLADLFLFTDPVNYNTALNQLSGSAYANYLQSFPSLGVHYNDLLDHATNCEVPALAGSVLECRASAPIHVWGQLDHQWRTADGDIEAGTAESKRFTGLLGVDANVGNAAIIGVSAGYVTNRTRDNQFGDNVDADGMQVGAYAVYDPGAFFVKGVTTYSWFDGDSTRHINFAGLATGATFAATPNGDPDIKMWTAGLHGGARFGMGGNSVITPYLNLDYVHAKLEGFTETGGNGAEQTVFGGKSNHTFLTGGVKWATQMGGVVPEVNLGYRYRFGNSRSRFNAAFLGDEASDFDIISASQKPGTFLAGLSVGGKLGPVDVRIGYEGEFNSDITSHSGNFKFVLPLGGRAAPPPPPPPIERG